MIFSSKAKEEFEVKSITSATMEAFVRKCSNIYSGSPDWLSEEEHIRTINFAKTVCEEVARLAVLGTKITVDGSARANYLQQEIEKMYYQLREWIEYGCAYGTVVLKPNGKSVDLVLPDQFIVTESQDGKINGIVFLNQETSEDGKKFYTRLEYHRFINETYVITNRCFVGDSKGDANKRIDIANTPWNNLVEEVAISDITSPLYGVLKMPNANNVDINSPLSLPIFASAIEELKDLDVAYSRNGLEIYDSEKIIFMDADRLLTSGGKIVNTPEGYERAKKERKLPHYVRMVEGTGSDDVYHEVNPALNTAERQIGISQQLSLISFKCGFSDGYFVFNQKTGMITATQVEADDRRTIQLIKDVRDKLESCLTDLIYAIDKFADLYTEMPVGKYEVTFDFGDITYNREEDRMRWWGYVTSGKAPAWMYFNKFEGMSEEEAKAMVAEAEPKETGLFDE